MKFRITPKPPRDLTQQHLWFAWRPVIAEQRSADGSVVEYWVWLASVARAGSFKSHPVNRWVWQYEIVEGGYY